MHGPLLCHLIVVASLLGAAPTTLPPRVAEAQRALADHHPATAINLLETTLGDRTLTSKADKDAVLALLRQAYEAAANQAETAGRPLDAESLRENARILKRKAGGSPGTAPAPHPQQAAAARPSAPESAPPVAVSPPVIEAPADAPPALPDVASPVATSRDSVADPLEVAPQGKLTLASTIEPDRLPAAAAPTPAPVAAPSGPTGPGLAEADAAFRAKQYPAAGRIYASLARDNQLPADRREHWAYCRSSEVARRIDAKPKTEAEWASIDAEITQIRALAPTNWLGEYLRNRASARPSARKASKGGSTIVRAASPDEAPAPRSNRAPRAAAAPVPAPTPPPARAFTEVTDVPPAGGSAPGQAGVPVGRWQVRESANFRVFHTNPTLAEKVVQVAEATRRDQTKRWTGSLPTAPWQPRCEVYLYPTAGQYAQMTGQPADSPGFSTMGMNDGQIISRRVNLRTDHDGLLGAVLPHEVTHVILADFFTEEQIPRWADEGMAVLTEPVAEQKRRAADLVEPLGRNLLFPIETLMKMDYPDNRYWSLYYAQSVSLTRFLVDQGTPAQLVQFLQGARTKGFEAELRRIYKIDGFNDLQARWVVYARANSEATAPTATAANSPRAERR